MLIAKLVGNAEANHMSEKAPSRTVVGRYKDLGKNDAADLAPAPCKNPNLPGPSPGPNSPQMDPWAYNESDTRTTAGLGYTYV